ncbi:unnamed protein product [Notodromas monacha]|uniref:Protein SMG7 n=1 Tax=Notodromas monacha TaxID=399045 RepID=A0A7R9BQG5_9CRUS|nr:unnamed protein product [Notodromas monacha]CAG0919753.1 unnamed protein product [Notodromas monacha]
MSDPDETVQKKFHSEPEVFGTFIRLLHRTKRMTFDTQKLYEEIILRDLDYALEKRVEQDLWVVCFRQQITHLQTLCLDKKNPRIQQRTAILKWYLSSTLGFYAQLLRKLCAVHQLDLNRLKESIPRSVSFCVQSCLVHLGDVCRYQSKNELAEHYYQHAADISPSSGQPFNQLGLLYAAKSDLLSACCLHARSLSVRFPFPAAAQNLSKLLEKFVETPENKRNHLSGNEYIDKFLRFHAMISSVDEEQLALLAATLASQLPPLVATESLSAEKLLQMITLNLYALQKFREDEYQAVIHGHLAIIFIAAILPTYTLKSDRDPREYFTLPIVYILLVWMHHKTDRLDIFKTRPHVWPSLCHLLNRLKEKCGFREPNFSVTLPEESDLRGFLPSEAAFAHFRGSKPSNASCGSPASNEERAVRILVLGGKLAELDAQFIKKNSVGHFDACRGDGPNLLQISREPSPTTSIENLSTLIALPEVKTPGILRLDTSNNEGKENESVPKAKKMHSANANVPGFAGKRGGFHNVELHTIMKKSGLLDASKPMENNGKQVKFRSPSPEVSNDHRAVNGHGQANGLKNGPEMNSKGKTVPPRLLSLQVSSPIAQNGGTSWNEPAIGLWSNVDKHRMPSQAPTSNLGNYPRPGFGQQIAASLTGPRSKVPTQPPNFATNSATGLVPPPKNFNNPPPSMQPYQGIAFPPPNTHFNNPSLQNGPLAALFAQRNQDQRPKQPEAIGSGRVKKPSSENYVQKDFQGFPQRPGQRFPFGPENGVSNGEEKAFESLFQRPPPPLHFNMQVQDAGDFLRFPPPPMVGADGKESGLNAKPQPLFPPNEITRDKPFPPSGLNTLFGNLQMPSYADNGYSLFGFPPGSGKNRVPQVPVGSSAVGSNLKRGGDEMQPAWNSLNGIGNGLFPVPPPPPTSIWGGISPLEKLLESSRNSGGGNKFMGFGQNHQDNGQPP